MKIALLHYHLKPGGVSTVVRQQANAIKNDCQVCILVGETGNSPPPCTFFLPKLAYRSTPCNPVKAAEEILSAINKAFGGNCDILHVHNPTLMKNVSLLNILKVLQNRGIRLLLQIHDFAEDGRPHAYSREAYPENCHYAAINSRDRRILQLAGLSDEGVHFLPNMVDESSIPSHADPGRPLVLYPVRAIRRKNIGEAILLSLFLSPGETLGITLPPNSDRDLASYNLWKSFCEFHRLRVEFELGNRKDFGALMQNASYVITTSVAEGFGFSYLEPWIYGKFLLGRRLPAICRDFEKVGVSLQHLYTRLRIPFAWTDEKIFYRKWADHLRQAALQLDLHVPDQMFERAFATLTGASDIDFGLLDEVSQQAVVARLIKHTVLRERLLAHNPHLSAFSKSRPSDNLIARNRSAVLSQFSADGYRRRLLKVYKRVIRREVSHSIDKRRLASIFLHPPGCSLLRWDI